jgi:hypothetical protein
MKKNKKENIGDIVLSVMKEEFSKIPNIDGEEVTKRISSLLVSLIVTFWPDKAHAVETHIELVTFQAKQMFEMFNSRNKGKTKTVKNKIKKRQLKK